MVRFTDAAAYKQLVALAESPFDLSQKGHLTPERLNRYAASACGYKLLYGTERVDDQVLAALGNLAKETEAISWMAKMQSGAILNRIEGYESENRAVLHTAARDFFDSPQTAPEAENAARLALKEVKKLQVFLEEVETTQEFTDLIMIGIGGSDLGPRANYLALQYLAKPSRRVHFISNVDPDDAAQVMKDLDLNKTLAAVVSKSGTTLETATNEAFVRAEFAAQGLPPDRHLIAITGEGSPMDNPSAYLKRFYIWDWIGGRYSSTSMVGGVLLAFAYGFDQYWEFLRGAHAMDQTALNSDLDQNLPLLAALLGIWNRNFLGYPTLAVIPYSQALLRYPAHLQQADMESNGKRINRQGKAVDFSTGPVIWGEPGTNAQHSFFQLLHQGTSVIPLEFIGFKESQYAADLKFRGTSSQEKLLSNLFAQMLALALGQEHSNPNKVFPGNRPSHLILGRKLTPYSLGALLSLFEHKIAFQGFIWGINSFDQEGVQLGKILADRILRRFSERERKGGEEYPLGDALIRQLEAL